MNLKHANKPYYKCVNLETALLIVGLFKSQVLFLGYNIFTFNDVKYAFYE